ncbi:hypothetical protein ACFWIY_25960 [Streptomyces sioyaensis]|uniref:hypothetical protein n=1 Tax=Streptomyces sioyaensis TaxID=67364 RepID=UPI0036603811
MAGAAVAAGVAAALLAWFGFILVEWYVATGATAAVPLMMRNHAKVFTRTCYVVGVGLLIWSVLGAMFLMLWFLPAALLLLVAAFADAGNRPGAWFAAITPLAAVAAAVAMVDF